MHPIPTVRSTRINENNKVIPPEKSVKRSRKYIEAESLMIRLQIPYKADVC